MTVPEQSRALRIVLVVGLLCALAACTGSPSPPSPNSPTTPPATSMAASAAPSPTPVPLGEIHDLETGGETWQWGEPIASLTGTASDEFRQLTREGWRVDLMGVYRLAPDRVLAEFRLDASAAARDDLRPWSDPNYAWWFHSNNERNGDYNGMVIEFSDVQLTVDGDDNTYLPVRTGQDFCLCSMNSGTMDGEAPAYVVLTAPEGAESVTLGMRDVGEFTDIPVAPMPERSVVPFGNGYQLRLTSLARPVAGTVRVRFSLELPAAPLDADTRRHRRIDQVDGTSPWDRATSMAQTFQNLLVLDPEGVLGGWPTVDGDGHCTSCTDMEGGPTRPGTAIDGEIDLADPGTDTLLLATTSGWILSAAPVGTSAASASTDVVEYRGQYRSPGVTVTEGERVDLDTSVLFAIDSAKLGSRAKAVLDKAAEALRQQAGRAVRVVGHTDSTGSESHNLDLSKRRARAVRDALADRLGAGWTFTVEGRGESDPKVRESGLSGEELRTARALNRRVEVTVG